MSTLYFHHSLSIAMMVFKSTCLLILISVLSGEVTAQCEGFTFPEDPTLLKQTKLNMAMYTDAMSAKEYELARKPHQWLLENVPELGKSIYIHGAEIFNELLKTSSDTSRKEVHFDSLMLIYDLRMEHCNEKSEIMARKAYDAYRHTINDSDRLEDNLQLFDDAWEEAGGDLPSYVLLPYMNTVRMNKKVKNNLDPEEVMERYTRITGVLDSQNEQNPEIRKSVDEMFYDVMGDVDCNFVRENLGPKLRQDTKNVKIAKLIFSLMLKGKCTDDPLWLEAGEVVGDNDPDFNLYKTLALKAQASGDTEKALGLFDKALEYAQDSSEKAEVYYRRGQMLVEQGNLIEVREQFRKAITANPSMKDAYGAIGNLYFNSYEQCSQGESQVQDRAVFLAAYTMYMKAGNTIMAAKAKEQFPSKEDIFVENLSVGDAIEVGCWINERVTIQTRD